MEALATPETLKEYGAIGAVGIMGLLCLLGMLFSTRQFNRVFDNHQIERKEWNEIAKAERKEWKNTTESMFDRLDATAQDQAKTNIATSKALSEVHQSIETNNKVLDAIRCLKRFS